MTRLTTKQRKRELLLAVDAGRVYRSERGHDLYQSYDTTSGRSLKVTARVDKLYLEGLITPAQVTTLSRPWVLTTSGRTALRALGAES